MTDGKLTLRKVIQITMASNVLEWYEYIIFAFLYSAIGKHFFSTSVPMVAALETFSVFALSYLARPFGSLFFGWLADNHSVSKSARIAMFMMAIPPIAIILIPSFSQIGILAPILLVSVRLIQGFAAGGELPASATFAYNHSESKYKRLACALVNCSSLIGVLLSSVTITVMHATLTSEQIIACAWKYPFYFSIPLILFLFWMRKDLLLMDKEEKPKSVKTASYWQTILQHKASFLTGFMVIASLQISFYLMFIWIPSYLSLFLKVPKFTASAFNTMSLSIMVVTVIATGIALIKFDGKKLLLKLMGVQVVVVPALFYLLIHNQSYVTLISVSVVFAILVGIIDAIALSFLGDLFKSDIRGIGMNLTFTLPAVFFGGFSPLIATWLIHQTGWLMMPAIMIDVVLLLSIPAVIKFGRELNNHQASPLPSA